MQFFVPALAAQLDPVTSILGVVAAVCISFISITLVASYYRFQSIVAQAEETDPEEMGASAEEVLRVQLARYLAGCARRGTSFTLALIRVEEADIAVCMDSPFVQSLKDAVRRDDVACLYDHQTAVLLLESEPEDAIAILNRIVGYVDEHCAGVQADMLHVGLASYPGHGLSGKELIAVAVNAVAEATSEKPIVLPEIIDEDSEEIEAEEDTGFDEEAEEDVSSKGWKERRKNSILDELTGVLKPSAVSAYMQRSMSELRRKKKNTALFCIGLNNMDHIARFHGEEAADDVMAGVSKVLQAHLRADDLIGRHERYAYLVLAACTLEEAEIIGGRITRLVQQSAYTSGHKKLKTTITLGVAAYPEHGRNLHHLYMAGQKVLDHSRANDIRAYAVYDPEIHDKVPAKPMKNIKSVQG
ncbi:sensor domain-containing diguanylate cyclase [Pontiella agarivorans]|uniref:Diguanylate cyclase n=1 Tax=Pontiella agarivorans TaxID=3038953 RepID=A0ABU5MXK6_9BACT|nr:diguanylate cyclase [Pontiella agarivorans]MDZ8118912.1 diguanylate cyclase [Pontiella agarivorans]